MLSLLCTFLAFTSPSVDRSAHFHVHCPTDAVLTVNGQQMHQTGPRRLLVSPPLPEGQTFTYDLRAFRDGQEFFHRVIEFQAGQTLTITIPEERPEQNFGVDVAQLQGASGITCNGQTITQAQAAKMLGNSLPDTATKRRLTVIGPPEARKQVLAELAGPLRELTQEYVIKDYDPTHWAVARTGFVTTGNPTIYAQEADGTVLFRQDSPDDLRRNLEAVRKPDPNYRPERDPDHRKGLPWPDTDQAMQYGGLGIMGWLLWLAFRSSSRPDTSLPS